MKSNNVKNKKTRVPIPYDILSPGFEAVYTGEKSSEPVEKDELITGLTTDKNGNIIRKWSTVTWTFPGQEKNWDAEIKYINKMQSELGPLDDNVRQIRAHIASLVPCDSGFPVTVDELLNAIGKGKLDEPSFHNGCWCPGMWWEQKTTQPFQTESMKTIHAVLTGYLSGKTKKDFISEFPRAEGFINRTYKWLGPVAGLTNVQKKMMDRMLLTIDFFTRTSVTAPGGQFLETAEMHDMELLGNDLFYNEDGQGKLLDTGISELTGLPKIHPRWTEEFRKNLESIENPQKKELYKTCCAIAAGVYTLSDCHHNTFRIIENWIHGIGAGKSGIPTRKTGTERQRMGQQLFGYVLGLDKWLVGIPMQFLLLDLGHIDIGFEVKNEILRVYAYLGEKRTPVKEWLAACLWHNLTYNSIAGNPGGVVRHKHLIEHAVKAGISLRTWMDSVLGSQQ
jgi:hypothetical protein